MRNSPALAVDDRVEITYRGSRLTGFLTSVDGASACATLDDGRRRIKGPLSGFRASDAPVPDGSPFASILRPGERVTFEFEGETVAATVVSGVAEVRVRADGARSDYLVPRAMLAPAPQLRADPPSPMDRWSVASFRRVGEGFEAIAAHEGRPVLRAACPTPSDLRLEALPGGPKGAAAALLRDAEAWAVRFGWPDPIDAAEVWFAWAAELKPFGVGASEHLAAVADEIEASAPRPR